MMLSAATDRRSHDRACQSLGLSFHTAGQPGFLTDGCLQSSEFCYCLTHLRSAWCAKLYRLLVNEIGAVVGLGKVISSPAMRSERPTITPSAPYGILKQSNVMVYLGLFGFSNCVESRLIDRRRWIRFQICAGRCGTPSKRSDTNCGARRISQLGALGAPSAGVFVRCSRR